MLLFFAIFITPGAIFFCATDNAAHLLWFIYWPFLLLMDAIKWINHIFDSFLKIFLPNTFLQLLKEKNALQNQTVNTLNSECRRVALERLEQYHARHLNEPIE